jgi:hypothetical protein
VKRRGVPPSGATPEPEASDLRRRLLEAEGLARRTDRAAAAMYLAVAGMGEIGDGAELGGWAHDGLSWLAEQVHNHAETTHAAIEGREPHWKTGVTVEP